MIFLKNFCFNEGVKVKRFYVSNENEFVSLILERNFFSTIKFSFCLVQQITPDEIQKYFIFGIRFDDLYIHVSLLSFKLNIEFKGKERCQKCFHVRKDVPIHF